jgi:hypothetical protein
MRTQIGTLRIGEDERVREFWEDMCDCVGIVEGDLAALDAL